MPKLRKLEVEFEYVNYDELLKHKQEMQHKGFSGTADPYDLYVCYELYQDD